MKPIWKIIIGIFVLIVVAGIGVFWYFSHNWKPIVELKLKEVVKNASDSLYRLTYDDLDLNLALGNVTLKNAALRPDSAVYAAMEKAGKAPDNVYHIRLKALNIRHFGVVDVVSNKRLRIKSIAFDSPDIQLVNKYHAYNDTVETIKRKKTLYESVKNILSSVIVRDIQADNITFKYTKIDAGKSSDLSLKNIQIHVHDVLIDETSQADTSRLYYTKLVEVKVPGFTYHFSDGFYTAKFDALKINTQAQNILLTNVDYSPVMDRNTYFKKRGENKTMMTLHFDTLRVEKLNFQKLIENQQTLAKSVQIKNGYVKLFGDKRYPKRPNNDVGQAPNNNPMHMKSRIHLDKVFVDNIDVVYSETAGKYAQEADISINHTKGMEANETTRSKKTLYESLKNMWSSVRVQDIQANNMAFKHTKIEDGKSSDLSLKNIQIRVHDVLIDETSQADTSRLYYTKLVEVNVPGFTHHFPDGFYKVKFDALKINTKKQNILFTNVDYRPAMDRNAYFKKRGKNMTMATLHFDTLRVEKLDFQKLIENQQMFAKSVQIKNGYVKLFGDKRYPKHPKNQIGQAPHQKLMRMKSCIQLEKVFVDNIDVVYGEMSGKYFREGEISFNHTKGVLTNVTNAPAALRKDRFMKADLRSKIMNSGNLHAKFSFNMLSRNGSYHYSGTVGAMKAPVFNRILHPLLNVEVGSGNIHGVSFDIDGTDYRSTGVFRFDYNDLKIDLLNEQGEKKPKRVLSFLVNKLIINDSNPDANEKYHIGKVDHKRVPEHTFFKNLWQSLLDGIKQTAGISKEREERLMGTAEKAKETAEKAKETAEKAKEKGAEAKEKTKNALKKGEGKVKKSKGFFKKVFKKKDQDKEEEQ